MDFQKATGAFRSGFRKGVEEDREIQAQRRLEMQQIDAVKLNSPFLLTYPGLLISGIVGLSAIFVPQLGPYIGGYWILFAVRFPSLRFKAKARKWYAEQDGVEPKRRKPLIPWWDILILMPSIFIFSAIGVVVQHFVPEFAGLNAVIVGFGVALLCFLFWLIYSASKAQRRTK
jgi:hypothetical protein